MIYTYDEVYKELEKYYDIEENPIGYSSLEKLPIRCFKYGNGSRHIIVSASWHSNEIISTTFVLKLLEYLTINNIVFNDIAIHFIPILNPEGYIINTSAIKKRITKNIDNSQLIKFCYEYYRLYKIDALNKDSNIKEHQELFRDINYKCIPKTYQILKDSVRDILANHPNGSIIDWASNGIGVDLNSNNINKIVSSYEYNKQNQYNNIRIDIPSPIGYPGNNQSRDFVQENELLAITNILEMYKDNLVGYFNYHSIGGMIYQRPECNNKYFEIYNYLLSLYYQEYSKYKIIVNKSNIITSSNDILRINYMGNLLIELSFMMGNPIGMFGDINNYDSTIINNINSFIYTIKNIDNIINITKETIKEDNVTYKILERKYIKKSSE